MKRVLACALALMLVAPSMSAMATELPDNSGQSVSAGESKDPAETDASDVPVESEQSADTEETKTGTDVIASGADVSTENAAPETSQEQSTTGGSENPTDEQLPGTDVPKTDADTENTVPETDSDTESITPETVQSPVKTETPEMPQESEQPSGTEVQQESEQPSGTEVQQESEQPSGTEVPQGSEETSDAEVPKTDAVTADAEAEEVPEEEAPAEVDEVQYNTGNCIVHVVNEEALEAMEEEEAFYDVFQEDGNYTINIPEANPFFPYEVQFTHDGETTNEWFMSPDDTVEVGGHTFAVSAYMDGTALTQMSLEVGGDTIIVYPEEKEFTNDGGISMFSLIPLESKHLSEVDLSGYTPLELTMVKVKSIFPDATDSTKIVWKYAYDDEDNYIVSGINDTIDLSWDTSYGWTSSWEMIVGDGDQLNPENIRYTIPINVSQSRDWLTSKVYAEDEQGNRSEIQVNDSYYNDSYSDSAFNTGEWEDVRIQWTEFSGRGIQDKTVYTSLTINKEAFVKTAVDTIKVVEGAYTTAEAAEKANDVTGGVICADMTKASAGYKIDGYRAVLTMIAYDASGKVIGVMPFTWYRTSNNDRLLAELYVKKDNSSKHLDSNSIYREEQNASFYLDDTYALNGSYNLVMRYDKQSSAEYPDVTAVYIGKYATIAEAQAAGAANIKDSVVGDINTVAGYAADYSQGIWFTVFAGEDSNPNQAVYSFCAKTKQSTPSTSLDSDSTMGFIGLNDADGNAVDAYVISATDDSYAEKNYVTILVGENVDLTKQYAPIFDWPDKATVYAEGSKTPEESGKSLHSFANGPIQYSVSAENGVNYKNYWVQIKKADSSNGQLYISSLKDKDANTRVENEVTYSNREVMLDRYHDYRHDICLANIGKTALPALSAELVSDVVELDSYWTLNGKQALAGLSTVNRPTWDSDLEGELPNLSKLRLRAKDGVANGTEISGTLTIKSGDKTLMVLTLTGMVGDPCITTTEIPDAVKFVPYGTMIQNSNKYSWITTSYVLENGDLPEGMEIKQNGELYGVPQETGTFTFEVKATFTSTREAYDFPEQYAMLTFNVKENTDDNVFYETDAEEGYILSTPIGTDLGNHYFYLDQITDSLFVSEGVLPEFKALWLNGEKLVAGTDYAAVSGSTRITISGQTLQNKANRSGRNTIAAEFRVDGDDNKDLRRTAQNFYLNKGNDGGGSGGSGGHSSHSDSDNGSAGGSGNGSSSTPTGVTIRGRLVDGSNRAMTGVTVELHSTPRTTVTDGNGYFQFAGVEYGQHELFVKDVSGNIVASRKFELREGGTSAFANDVFTAPNGTIVNMTVTVADGAMTFSNILFAAAQTGDDTNVAGWVLALLLSCAALTGMAVYKKKRKC